jgi:hypothetical protein
MNNTPHERFIPCACATEGLFVSYWPDDQQLYVSKFVRAPQGRPGLWFRLKTAWNVLRNGESYKDEIIMEPEQIRELKAFVDDVVMKIEQKT